LARPGAGNAAGTYRRMLLNKYDAGQGSFVPDWRGKPAFFGAGSRDKPVF